MKGHILELAEDVVLNPRTFHLPLFEAINANDLTQIGAVLRENPVSLNFMNPDGLSPLMFAVLFAETSTVSFLLQHQPDLEQTLSKCGITAIFLAVNNLEKTKLLLDAGAKVDHLDHFGNSVFHYWLTGTYALPPALIDILLDASVPSSSSPPSSLSSSSATPHPVPSSLLALRDSERASPYELLLNTYIAQPAHARDADALLRSVELLLPHCDINADISDSRLFDVFACGYADARAFPYEHSTMQRALSVYMLYAVNCEQRANALERGSAARDNTDAADTAAGAAAAQTAEEDALCGYGWDVVRRLVELGARVTERVGYHRQTPRVSYLPIH